MKWKSLVGAVCVFTMFSSVPAYAQDVTDNRNSTIDSKVEIQEADPDEGAQVLPQADPDQGQPVERKVNTNTAKQDLERQIKKSRPKQNQSVEDSAAKAEQGTESSGGGDGASPGGGSEGVSNKEIQEKVDKAVSEDNTQYKTVLDYFAAYLDGAMYHWGGPIGQVGAGGDCSGAIAQLVQIITGGNPWQRLFTTTDEGQALTSKGFTMADGGGPKPGQFFVGWSGGHTASILPSGVKFESGGSNSGEGGNSINAYGRPETVGGDDPQFTSGQAYLDIKDMPKSIMWDEGVKEWEEYLDGVSWKPWDDCARAGSGGPVNPCAGVTDSINEENGWTEKKDKFPKAA